MLKDIAALTGGEAISEKVSLMLESKAGNQKPKSQALIKYQDFHPSVSPLLAGNWSHALQAALDRLKSAKNLRKATTSPIKQNSKAQKLVIACPQQSIESKK